MHVKAISFRLIFWFLTLGKVKSGVWMSEKNQGILYSEMCMKPDLGIRSHQELHKSDVRLLGLNML